MLRHINSSPRNALPKRRLNPQLALRLNHDTQVMAQELGRIGDLDLPCSVLDDETRLLSEREFTKALGGKRGGAHWKRRREGGVGADLPVFISAPNLIPFMSRDLVLALSAPIVYLTLSGMRANGINATIIPDICDVFLKARAALKLHKSQEHFAAQAESFPPLG